MPNYRETQVVGAAWVRSNQIIIDNPLNGVPTVKFAEERVISVDADVVTRTAEGISFVFDPSYVVPLINPVTDAATGATITGGEIYAILYSLYRAKAADRDDAIAQAAADAQAAAAIQDGPAV